MPSMIKLTQHKFSKMTVRPIKNKKDYAQALERLEAIFDAKKILPTEMNLRS